MAPAVTMSVMVAVMAAAAAVVSSPAATLLAVEGVALAATPVMAVMVLMDRTTPLPAVLEPEEAAAVVLVAST